MNKGMNKNATFKNKILRQFERIFYSPPPVPLILHTFNLINHQNQNIHKNFHSLEFFL